MVMVCEAASLVDVNVIVPAALKLACSSILLATSAEFRASSELTLVAPAVLLMAARMAGYTGDRAKVFEIFIQSGAMLAIVWEYRRRFGAVLGGLGRVPSMSVRAPEGLLGRR